VKIVSFESRRAKEIESLLRAKGFDPFVAPALREVPIEENAEAFTFGERLLRGDFDLLVCLTGVGLRYLIRVLSLRHPEAELKNAIAEITTVVRGPKPAAAMREMGLTPTLIAREPSTWREVLAVLEGRPEKRAAVQEYGRRENHLIEGMISLGMDVTPVPVYQWAFPTDIGPLNTAIDRLLARDFDWAVFTTGTQLDHLLQLAEQRGLRDAVRNSLAGISIASIGPSTSEALEHHGLHPAFVASQPKMGMMIHELARRLNGGSAAGTE